MKRLSFAATPEALAALVACQRAPGPLSTADEAALRSLDSAFAAAANAGNAEALTAAFAADATVLPLYMPPAQGADAIRQLWTVCR